MQARQGYLPDPANPSGPRKNYGVAPGVAPLFNLWPEQNGPALLDANGNQTGIALAYSNPMQHIREDFGTTRFDYNISPRDLFFGVYTVDDSTADTPTQNPLASINEDLREQVASLQEQHVFSPRCSTRPASDSREHPSSSSAPLRRSEAQMYRDGSQGSRSERS